MSEPFVPPTLERSGSASVQELRDRYPGATAYIVGKGPSLRYLRASDFGPGPVITLNDAITHVAALGLPNPILAMQKDGCEVADPDNEPRPCHTCEPLGWQRAPLVNPGLHISTIFSRHLSSWCLHGRPNRYVFDDLADFGDESPWTMSVLSAIPFARLLGAAAIVMVCFDNFTKNELGSAFPRGDPAKDARIAANLEWVQPRILERLEGMPHSFFTPAPTRSLATA